MNEAINQELWSDALYLSQLTSHVALELDDEKTSIIAGNRYKEKKAKYEMENFSEAKLMTNEYYVF